MTRLSWLTRQIGFADIALGIVCLRHGAYVVGVCVIAVGLFAVAKNPWRK